MVVLRAFIDDEGALTEALQASINEVLKHFEGQDDFKEGLVVLVGCGWGKGYVTQVIESDHPHWRFESMSAADLVRLSWLGDMNPGYFWRIQDGLEAVRKAGVQIFNPNGILNLIGWVRSNNGHFVPHSQLPQGEISPERPLMLNPPLNLLREVRADADRGYDRHCAVDNTGTWHEVQHVSPNPFFSSESARRVYASMDDVRRRDAYVRVRRRDSNFGCPLPRPTFPKEKSSTGFGKWRMNGCIASAMLLISAARLRPRCILSRSMLSSVRSTD